MNPPEGVARLLGLAVPPAARQRFVEEWIGDLAAARSQGLTRRAVLAGAVLVAAFVVLLHLREPVRRRRSGAEVVAVGCGAGLLLAVADAPSDRALPLVLLPVGWWLLRAVRAWIEGGR